MHRQMSYILKKMGRTCNKEMLRVMMSQIMGKRGIGNSMLPPSINTDSSQSNFENLSGINFPKNLSGFGKK